MKTFLSILFVTVLTMTAALASGNPKTAVTIIKAETVTVTTSELDSKLFVSAEFNEDQRRFEFNTEKEVSFIQIFNNKDQMIMQLPAMSKDIKLGMSLFNKGDYKLGFLIEGTTVIQFTNVTIN